MKIAKLPKNGKAQNKNALVKNATIHFKMFNISITFTFMKIIE